MIWRIRLAPCVPTPGDIFPALDVSVSGDTITINGEVIDLSGLADGDKLFGSAVDHPLVVGIIERNGTEITIPILFPIAYGASLDARFPDDIVMVTDGPVILPQTEVAP